MVNCEVREREGVVVIAISGDVDLDSSPKVRDVLLDCVGSKRPVLVDMSGVSYIDSSGVASLVEAHQSARKGKSTFALADVSQSAMRVLELARLDKVFTIHSSLADALGDAG
jgi:anti-sigma B factor antagonist